MSNKAKAIETIARGVCVKAGKLLLCHTKGANNTYLPGGHVEFGETARDSLQREIREELGVSARVGRFLGVVEHTYMRKRVLQHEVNFVFEFTCRELHRSKEPQSREDYIEFCWASSGKLARFNLEPGSLRKLIPQWLADRGGSNRWSSTM